MDSKYITIEEIRELECDPVYNIDNHFKVWSIWEIMDKFSVALLSSALSSLSRLGGAIALDDVSNQNFNHEEVLKQFREEFTDALRDIKLSRVLRGQINRIEKRLGESDCSIIEIHTMFREIHNNILEELTLSRFLRIREDRRPYFEPPDPLFGQEVVNIFPDTSRDISAAGRCLALDEWTACVFHLMRVLEVGLHKLAKIIGLDGKSLELENWKSVIDQIEKEIRNLEQTPKSSLKTEKLQFYSEAASGFRYFKNAWRNHVSHSRANYDEREAIVIYNNVQAFMQILAKQSEATNAGGIS